MHLLSPMRGTILLLLMAIAAPREARAPGVESVGAGFALEYVLLGLDTAITV